RDLGMIRMTVEAGVRVDVGRMGEIENGVEVFGEHARRELGVPAVEKLVEVAVARLSAAVEVLAVGVVKAGRIVDPRGACGRDLREPQVRIAEEKDVRLVWVGGPVKAEDLHRRDALRGATEPPGGGPRARTPGSSARPSAMAARGKNHEAGDRQ